METGNVVCVRPAPSDLCVMRACASICRDTGARSRAGGAGVGADGIGKSGCEESVANELVGAAGVVGSSSGDAKREAEAGSGSVHGGGAVGLNGSSAAALRALAASGSVQGGGGVESAPSSHMRCVGAAGNDESKLVRKGATGRRTCSIGVLGRTGSWLKANRLRPRMRQAGPNNRLHCL